MLLILIILFLHFQGLASQALDANGLSLADKVLGIERLLLTPGTIIFPVTPCQLDLNEAPFNVSGDQTAAQWMRTVFHDFITANATAGTGGLDASVSFETDREENLGLVSTTQVPGQSHESFINETIIGFNLFSTVFVSTADFIALGLAVSLLSCDPDARMIKLRAGRIDATGPGPLGVPRPQDGLDIATAAFANAGFNQSDMIQAVACGHSVGAVHRFNFPEVVSEADGIGADGADTFDSTPFVFDNTGVNEYLNGSGKAGGPLVTTANETYRSDLRIFTSDNNATINAMASSQSFEDACFTIFERMINTVPKGQTLSDVIGPRSTILKESHLDLSPVNGAVQYSGTITSFSRTNSLPENASYYYGTIGGGNTGNPKYSQPGVVQSNIVNGVVSAPFGTITDYAFNDTFNSPSITSINVQGVYSEAINLNLFVLPSQSFEDPTNRAQPKYIIRAALLTSLSPKGTTLTGTLYYPASQPNSVAPKYTQEKATLVPFKTLGSYTIFQGIIIQPSAITTSSGGTTSVDVQLGTTQRSAKVFGSVGSISSFFGTCTNSDLTTC